MFKLDLEKAEEPEIKLPTSVGLSKKVRVPEEHILELYWLPQSLWLFGSQQTVDNSEKDGEYQTTWPASWDICANHKTRVSTEHGTMYWFQIGKAVHQGCILSLSLFNLHAEYIKQSAGLDEARTGIKVIRRNISNLIYAHDTTLMAESEG